MHNVVLRRRAALLPLLDLPLLYFSRLPRELRDILLYMIEWLELPAHWSAPIGDLEYRAASSDADVHIRFGDGAPVDVSDWCVKALLNRALRPGPIVMLVHRTSGEGVLAGLDLATGRLSAHRRYDPGKLPYRLFVHDESDSLYEHLAADDTSTVSTFVVSPLLDSSSPRSLFARIEGPAAKEVDIAAYHSGIDLDGRCELMLSAIRTGFAIVDQRRQHTIRFRPWPCPRFSLGKLVGNTFFCLRPKSESDRSLVVFDYTDVRDPQNGAFVELPVSESWCAAGPTNVFVLSRDEAWVRTGNYVQQYRRAADGRSFTMISAVLLTDCNEQTSAWYVRSLFPFQSDAPFLLDVRITEGGRVHLTRVVSSAEGVLRALGERLDREEPDSTAYDILLRPEALYLLVATTHWRLRRIEPFGVVAKPE